MEECYEGEIDLDAITDPTVLMSKRTQINEFGQIPKQLFKYKHPKRSDKVFKIGKMEPSRSPGSFDT